MCYKNYNNNALSFVLVFVFVLVFLCSKTAGNFLHSSQELQLLFWFSAEVTDLLKIQKQLV